MKKLDWTPSGGQLKVGDRITVAGDPQWIAGLGWEVNEDGHAVGIITHVVTAATRKGKR